MSGLGITHHVVPPGCLARSAEQAAPHLRAIWAATAAGVIGLGHVVQHAGAFRFASNKPIVLIVGDDFDLSFGPAAFHRKSLRRFLRDAGAAVIVSGAPDSMPYGAALAGAILTGKNAIIIESREAHEPAWIALVKEAQPRLPLLVSTPGATSGVRH
ncbi:hypothetical protein [Lichenibacterium ramalinae]|uniref:Uncharacterized protein n=1 Tax=Lichenibacterium ramalinae TaxID=2316527 RepID=A0A4Q2R589_9HYPH|nr:hypothetical protein [Lichenibacterium ramalinae]RYB01512.1 hypothetical protein D3272_25830 [Lichenibacterium ramalinae]